MATEEGKSFNQPTPAPSTKLTAAAVGGAVATIIIVLTQTFFGITFPAGFEGAVAVLAAFVLGYFVKERAIE